MSNSSTPALTRGMKIALVLVGGVIIIGAAIIVALAMNGAAPDQAGSSASAPPASSTPPKSGPLPGATPTSGSEVQPPTAPPHTGLPRLETPIPLIPAPLPDSAARSGGLAAGFPDAVVGPMDGSNVVSSSIATEGAAMQVDLVAVTKAGPDEIRSHYSRLWSSLGMQERTVADGTVAFTGPYESMTLAVETTGTGTRYTIHAVFRTE
ncbi:MAG: hypothetical protein WBA87_08495 [Microbacterium sp.]